MHRKHNKKMSNKNNKKIATKKKPFDTNILSTEWNISLKTKALVVYIPIPSPPTIPTYFPTNV